MNVGIIGCNTMGLMHCQMAANAGLNIVACGDISRDNAVKAARKFGADSIEDCFALCKRDDVDVVAICTPTPTHTEYVKAAAEGGKHIFCEKPLGRTMEKVEDALDAVKKAGVKLYVGHVLRFFQEFEAMKAQVDAGTLGKVGFVKTYRGGIFPGGKLGWFSDWNLSGGVTVDTIVHDMDWLRYVFGDPVRVFSQNLKRVFSERIDYALVTMRMKSGVICNIVGTWAHPSGFGVKVDICGDKGMVTFDSNEAPIAAQLRQETGAGPSTIVPGSPVPVSPYQLEWEDFMAWIDGKGEPRVTPDDALWGVRMALGALESAETGQPVEF
ncbi:MAG: Gfo/Idh/MocA family oxidoreductase [Candidatus Hydrogenedentes bacterium]|nr:Gfo/Idh/MocA family oxidoreductase [Candidatus Hydrogenedentota bacterium]